MQPKSHHTLQRRDKNEPVSLEVLMRICQVFHCDIGDICAVILDEDQNTEVIIDGNSFMTI